MCPIGQPDNYTVKAGKSIEIDFNKVFYLTDKDPGGGAMSASIVIQPQQGTLTLNKDGSFTYKHNGSGEVKIILFMLLQTQLVTIPKNLKYLVWLK